MPRDPGRDWTKISYPGTRPGLKVESHPGAGQGFQPPAGTPTQISVPCRPLARGQSSNVVEWEMMSMFLGNNGERERTVDSLPDGLSLES